MEKGENMRFKHRPLMLSIMVLMLVILATSCDKRNIPVALEHSVSLQRFITSITATPDTIYADHNITYSQIRVQVKDGEGFGVPNQIVSFRTDLGRVLTNVPTDSTGVATSTFWDDGDVGEATITAVVRNYMEGGDTSLVSEDTKTINVRILEVPAIESINLKAPTTSKVTQNHTVTATVKNELGQNVPNNTLVTFDCVMGSFWTGTGEAGEAGSELGNTAVARTMNGIAKIVYKASNLITDDEHIETITASIGAVTKSQNVIITAGDPAALSLQTFVVEDGEATETDTCPLESEGEIRLSARLTDIFGNVCGGKRVKFGTDLGTFINTSQQINVSTQADGIASTRLIPGLQAGAATITASANGDTLQAETVFTITSSEIYSIGFTQESTIELDVANTGGTESAILRVKLRDINGNLVDTQQPVWFQMVGTVPSGANINNQPPTQPVMVMSTGGEAQVSVNAGTQSGVLGIRASHTRESDGVEIFATKPNIVIKGGPAANITPFIGRFNTGHAMGGGLWRVVAGANVHDIYGNPVANDNLVFFELLNNVTNCTIESWGAVGNVSVDDDSLAGTAYTFITYPGICTNESVVVKASTISGINPTISGVANLQLPLNEPHLEILPNPLNVNFHPAGATWQYSSIYCIVTDGQGSLIGRQKILLTASLGSFVYVNSPQQNLTQEDDDPIYGLFNDPFTPWIIQTATMFYPSAVAPDPLYEQYHGRAKGRIKFHYTMVPVPEGEGAPGQNTSSITATLFGYDVSANVTVLLWRWANPF